MNQFELFCMVYYVLDAEWNETKDPIIGEYLSGANPFAFTDIGSADPSVFIDFCGIVGENITIDNSYSTALNYINTLNNGSLTNAFLTITEDEWKECVADYLSQGHKGGN